MVQRVVNILQSSSIFEPDIKNYEAIVKSFIEKSNIYIYIFVALSNGVIFGYSYEIIEY